MIRDKVGDELKKRFGEADEPLRLTLVPKLHEKAALAFLSLNILIRQENVLKKRMGLISKACDEVSGVFFKKDKELRKVYNDVEKKYKKLEKNIAEIDKLIEKADERKWPETLPKCVMEELVVPNGENNIVENQEVFASVIGTSFLCVRLVQAVTTPSV